MTQISECDNAIILVHGLEILAGANGNEPLITACTLVLDGLLEIRIHLPQQATRQDGATRCTGSASTRSTPTAS